MLRTAFIGAGPRSQNAHYPNVNRLPEVEMVAACELDEARLHEVAVAYDFQYRYDDHRRMLDEVDPDLVYCVMHERWLLQPALDCLNAGKNIFIEKPPGMNMDEVQQIHDAAVANDVICAVGFQRRHAAVTREAMRQVARLGPVSTAVGVLSTSGCWARMRSVSRRRTGTIFATRWTWCAIWWAASRWRWRHTRTSFDSDYRNCYTGLVRFDNGATGFIHGNRASGGRVLRGELHGTGVGCYFKIPHEIEITEDNEARTLGGWQIDGVAEADTYLYDGVLTMHEHIVDCVRTGEKPLTDIRDAIHSMALVAQLEGVNGRG